MRGFIFYTNVTCIFCVTDSGRLYLVFYEVVEKPRTSFCLYMDRDVYFTKRCCYATYASTAVFNYV